MSKDYNLQANLSEELRFLVNCCKNNLSDDDTKEILSYINTPSLDMNPLIRLANQHGVLPLVYKTLKKLHIDDQEHFLKELKSTYTQIAQRNMLMSAKLIRIMKLLEKNNIDALAFKGPILSQMAYGDITLRQYSDLDIYVDREDMVKISNILSNDHYDSRVKIKYFSNEAFLNVNSDVQFYHKKGSILIEIHWTVFRSAFSNTMKKIDLWSSPEKVHIQNYELKTFRTETLLLYLCMHGSKHIWERIEWIVDVDKLIRTSSSIDWKEVYKLAQTVNGKTMLELGLYLSSNLFHTPIPDEIREKLNQSKIISHLSSDVLIMLNKQEYFSDTELQKNYRHFRFHLSIRNTTVDKVSFIIKTLLPLKSADIEIINLPKALYFLYYLIRPFRLGIKYIQKILNRSQ
ncbi:hypothetical protein TSL6_10270 [Sulfurovum sp. TSL6]|uniref:nucleotidyltransferase domain-containing protein n=1 Tax=Sulfurovum sp. TSL6 TaxID=2826995 RepID=UPI001CC3B35E|nr:nucleotidyltransferase family protein [Sulfurovum sp. TSL6]GIU00521.1 hypothetical protein TSL6_10270 [Sulfurovum sp. TSL6]